MALKQPIKQERLDDGMDTGWAWLVLVAALLARMTMACLFYNIGVLNVAFLDYFDDNVSTTSLIGSIFSGVFFLTGPLASIVINRFNCRVAHIIGGFLSFLGFSVGFFATRIEIFIFTYSLVGGIAYSLCYMVTIVIPSFNFKKRLGLAVGLSAAGSGVGLTVCGPFTQFLLDTYGIHGTFLIMGAMTFNLVLFGAIMRPTTTEKAQKLERNRLKDNDEDTEKEKSGCNQYFQWEIFKNKAFMAILVSDFLWTIPNSITMSHLPNLSVLSGFSKDQSAWLVTVIGFGSTFNRLLTGLSLGPEGLDPLLLFLGCNGVMGVFALTFPLYSFTYTGQVIFALMFGIYTGGLHAVRNPLCVNIVGLKYLSTAVGLMFFTEGVAFFVSSPIAGGCFILAFLLSLVATIWRKQEAEITSQPENKTYQISAQENTVYENKAYSDEDTDFNTRLNENSTVEMTKF